MIILKLLTLKCAEIRCCLETQYFFSFIQSIWETYQFMFETDLSGPLFSRPLRCHKSHDRVSEKGSPPKKARV